MWVFSSNHRHPYLKALTHLLYAGQYLEWLQHLRIHTLSYVWIVVYRRIKTVCVFVLKWGGGGGGGGGGYRKGTLAWNALTSHYHWHMIEIGLYQEDPKLLLAATFWVRDVKSMTNTGKYLRSHWHPLIFKPHIASKKMKVVKIVKKLVYWKFCGSVQNDLFYMMNSFLMTCQNRLPQNHLLLLTFQ